MTQFIKHRTNAIADLKDVDPSWGVEIDLRSMVDTPAAMHLSHDPWTRGDDFRAWLAAFKARGIKGPLILNTKEDGLEGPLIEIMEKEKIENYFFLDTTIPTLIQWSVKTNQKKFAVRLSTYESFANAVKFEGLVDWAWIDCFGGEPLADDLIKPLKGRFKLCLVSPELQRQPVEKIEKFRSLGGICDAICTKRPDLWS